MTTKRMDLAIKDIDNAIKSTASVSSTDLLADIHKLITEWNREHDFLFNSDHASDRTAAQAYLDCAVKLRKTIEGNLIAIKQSSKDICREIGCSGLSPDICQNRPQDCTIIRDIKGRYTINS